LCTAYDDNDDDIGDDDDDDDDDDVDWSMCIALDELMSLNRSTD